MAHCRAGFDGDIAEARLDTPSADDRELPPGCDASVADLGAAGPSEPATVLARLERVFASLGEVDGALWFG